MPAKTERLQIRLTTEDYETLSRLAVELGLDDMSATVRFLVREKARERGLTPEPAKKKRRSAT